MSNKIKKVPGLYGIGDIHGMLDEMMLNLEDQGVVSGGKWTAGAATLVCTGDLTDRGPEGYEVVEKLHDLQEQAIDKNGNVIVTIGNHDVGFLNCAVFLVRRPELKTMFEEILSQNEVHDRKKVYEHSNKDKAKYKEIQHAKIGMAMNVCMNYRAKDMPEPQGVDLTNLPDEGREMAVFQDQISDMLLNGMNLEDLLKVCESDLLKWAVAWPAMVAKDGVLFQHCDSSRAYKYLEKAAGDFVGTPMEKVNCAVTMIMLDPSIVKGYALWEVLTSGRYWEDNQGHIQDHIDYFAPGCTKVAHGHTRLFGEYLPMEYAEGRAVNLDVGLAYSPHHFGKTGRMSNFTEHAGKHRRKE